ncbi:MAG TPA: hypothetical protein VFF98_08185 [Novosphingobium sp.]|nr:hypothetical protein [Novosphingobium sp.]HZV08305.1 hypothetical protein [Novosphingobium sp.]
MRKLPASCLAMLALAGIGCTAAPATARERLTGEQQLAKMLQGRQAGAPVDCVSIISLGSSTVIDKTAIVYDSGSVLYVNRTDAPDQLASDDILVTKTSLDQLCHLDIMQLRDRAGGFYRGSVGLGQFVPWTRVPKDGGAKSGH